MINVMVFGAASEIIGSRNIQLPEGIASVNSVKEYLRQRYPALKGLKSLMVAVNKEYAEDDQPVSPTDEVALIPPVSGG